MSLLGEVRGSQLNRFFSEIPIACDIHVANLKRDPFNQNFWAEAQIIIILGERKDLDGSEQVPCQIRPLNFR